MSDNRDKSFGERNINFQRENSNNCFWIIEVYVMFIVILLFVYGLSIALKPIPDKANIITEPNIPFVTVK